MEDKHKILHEMKLDSIHDLKRHLKTLEINVPVLITRQENSTDFFGIDICNEFENLNNPNELKGFLFFFQANVFSKNEEVGVYTESKNLVIENVDINKYEVVDHRIPPDRFMKEDLITKNPIVIITHVEKEMVKENGEGVITFKGGFKDIFTGGIDLEIEIEEIIVLRIN